MLCPQHQTLRYRICNNLYSIRILDHSVIELNGPSFWELTRITSLLPDGVLPLCSLTCRRRRRRKPERHGNYLVAPHTNPTTNNPRWKVGWLGSIHCELYLSILLSWRNHEVKYTDKYIHIYIYVYTNRRSIHIYANLCPNPKAHPRRQRYESASQEHHNSPKPSFRDALEPSRCIPATLIQSFAKSCWSYPISHCIPSKTTFNIHPVTLIFSWAW
jgi:hypothetical protein